MKTGMFAIAALAAATLGGSAAAQLVVQPVAPATRLPANVVLPACLTSPPPGAAIIGEKTPSVGIIGEKSSSAGIIGEKTPSEGIIGEKGVDAPSQTFGDKYSASGFTSFNHVLVGKPGRLDLNLYGCSSASGGETIAVYLADAKGRRKTGWRLFVIGTRNGNNRQGTLTLPPPARGQKLSRQPIVVVVENASGRPHVGEYRLTVTR